MIAIFSFASWSWKHGCWLVCWSVFSVSAAFDDMPVKMTCVPCWVSGGAEAVELTVKTAAAAAAAAAGWGGAGALARERPSDCQVDGI